MDEFNGRSESDMAIAAIAAEPRRGEGEHRPQPLAPGRDDVPGELRDERDRAAHALEDERVDALHIVLQKGVEPVERGFGRRFLLPGMYRYCHVAASPCLTEPHLQASIEPALEGSSPSAWIIAHIGLRQWARE